MRSILAGIETEYGLLVGGRGADHQVDDATALVRAYPGECFVGWDYRFENPRADLRGFNLEKLSFDPEDAKFDSGKKYGPAAEIRSDRVLPNGARFYNDHGHPEYSTPECLSLQELADHDCAGQRVVQQAADAFALSTGADATVYKNNTDFHGASYGTHENYLVPRSLGFDRLFQAVLPMLVVRPILVGAGKVGSELGAPCDFQISQRADFFVEPANAETLFRRPIFNTRDEPHADPSQWIRLHVIAGDANMISEATARKVGLLKLALHLCEQGSAPDWKFANPVTAIQSISRDKSYDFKIDLSRGVWTTAYEVLESYFAAAEATLDLDDDMRWVIDSSRQLLIDLRQDFPRFARQVDWAAKRLMLEMYAQEEGWELSNPALRAYDLEYHNVQEADSLHTALAEIGHVTPNPERAVLDTCLADGPRTSRAWARGLAVHQYGKDLLAACWSGLVFGVGEGKEEIYLPPEGIYPAELAETKDVGTFIEILRGVK